MLGNAPQLVGERLLGSGIGPDGIPRGVEPLREHAPLGLGLGALDQAEGVAGRQTKAACREAAVAGDGDAGRWLSRSSRGRSDQGSLRERRRNRTHIGFRLQPSQAIGRQTPGVERVAALPVVLIAEQSVYQRIGIRGGCSVGEESCIVGHCGAARNQQPRWTGGAELVFQCRECEQREMRRGDIDLRIPHQGGAETVQHPIGTDVADEAHQVPPLGPARQEPWNPNAT